MNYSTCDSYNMETSKYKFHSKINASFSRGISFHKTKRKKSKKRNKYSKNNNSECDDTKIRGREYDKNMKGNNDNELYLLIKDELVIFCKNTTMRGIPRIIKAQSRELRILWITFVVILFIGLLLSMIFLTRQYLEYSVIHPPVILPDQEPPFPSISVCNLRPISRSGIEILSTKNWRSPRKFGLGLGEYVAAKWYYNDSTKHYYTQLTSAMSMNGYLESIPFNILYTLGHSLDELVIYCLVLYNVGSKREINRCNALGKWTPTTHALYLNCYSLTLYPHLRNQVKTVSMYLYLDEILKKDSCPDCFIQELKSQLSGALVVVHTPDTYPDINQEAVNLQPGTLTEFNLKFILNKNKAPPYGRCSKYTEKYIKLHNHDYIYSEHACQHTTIQREVNDICKCNAIEYPIFNLSLPFCSALPSFVSYRDCKAMFNKNKVFISNSTCDMEIVKVYTNHGCKNNIIKKYRSDVVAKCTLPCSYFSYASDRSTSTWPTKNFQLTWIKSEIAKQLRKKRDFQPYLKLMNLSDEGHEKEALEILDKLDILERNLLGIMINRPNNKVHLVEEKEVLSLTSYLSQAGGLFSIFIGLSIISVVEFIELLIHCVEAFKLNYSKKRGYSTDSDLIDKGDNDIGDSKENQTMVEHNSNPQYQSKFYEFNILPNSNSNKPQTNDLWILQSQI